MAEQRRRAVVVDDEPPAGDEWRQAEMAREFGEAETGVDEHDPVQQQAQLGALAFFEVVVEDERCERAKETIDQPRRRRVLEHLGVSDDQDPIDDEEGGARERRVKSAA